MDWGVLSRQTAIRNRYQATVEVRSDPPQTGSHKQCSSGYRKSLPTAALSTGSLAGSNPPTNSVEEAKGKEACWCLSVTAL